MIVLLACDTSPLRNDGLFERAYNSVGETRRRKTDRLRFMKDKCLSLGAGLLLKEACGRAGIRYAEESFVTGTNGKPMFADPGCFFNLSHSGDRAFCALADKAVGCDVEQVTVAGALPEQAACCEQELNLLRACASDDSRRKLFYRLWTLKESYLKCTGSGLICSPDTVRLSLDGKVRLENSELYSFYDWYTEDGYQYACCVMNQEKGDRENCEIEWKDVSYLTAAIPG